MRQQLVSDDRIAFPFGCAAEGAFDPVAHGIEQILVTYPNVVAGGFTVAPDDGTTHFGLVTVHLGSVHVSVANLESFEA